MFYKDRWTLVKGEMLGNLSKEKTGRFAKIIFYFLQACDTNTCSLEIIGKAVNQGDGKGKKIPCKLYFSADGSFTNKTL